ncbi:O-antigen ligase family protein [Pokkaliibacter sp. MBI-7]|uniref:O-antigen ligase family protein n=1 Tax=Pokkaliibacter sp. MBI-7 TaxID=3040600 RepID=UPI00244B31D4|nr:O-antigen ligase family protein [Pokkaliibacter sp. MBI-7]MDH2432983.1 O-antigen ligase family protein [Pokkaliibacter sp. MBI-7]
MIATVALFALLLASCIGILLSPSPELAPMIVPLLVAMIVAYKKPEWVLMASVLCIPFEGAFGIDISANKFLAPLFLILAMQISLKQIPFHQLRSNLWLSLSAFMLFYVLSLWYSQARPLSLLTLRELLLSQICFAATIILAPRLNLLLLAKGIALGAAFTFLITDPNAAANGREAGFAGDPNYYALLVDVGIVFTLLLVTSKCHWMERLLWIGILLILTKGLVRTESRSGLVVLALVMLVCLWHYRYLLRHLHPRHFGFALLGVIILAGAASIMVPTKYIERIESLASLASGPSVAQDASLGRRTSYLIVGLQVVADHPLFGTGPGTFPLNYARSSYAAAFSHSPDRMDLYRVAHNTYMQMAADTGLPSTITFVSLFLLAFRNYYSARKHFLKNGQQQEANLMTHYGLALMTTSIFMLFLNAPEHKYIWFFIALSSFAAHLTQQHKLPTDAPLKGMS